MSPKQIVNRHGSSRRDNKSIDFELELLKEVQDTRRRSSRSPIPSAKSYKRISRGSSRANDSEESNDIETPEQSLKKILKEHPKASSIVADIAKS
jgi:hypothetical protein